jgi:hypothetical protein
MVKGESCEKQMRVREAEELQVFKKVILMSVCLLASACGDGWDPPSALTGPYQLTFTLDSSFQAPHGNQPIRIALVRLTDNVVIAEDSGYISVSGFSSFRFATAAVMERGVSYAVHYWIDSNIGGGTLGVCDSTVNDHQWSVEFFSVTNNINFTVGYAPLLTEYVCDTFP